MNTPHENESVPQRRPNNKVAAVLSDRHTYDGVLADLTGLGVDLADLNMFDGADGAEVFDLSGEHHGWRAHLVRSWTNLGGADANLLSVYDEALKAGRVVVLVPAPDQAAREGVIEVLQRHGGAGITYFGHGTAESIR